MEKLGLKDLTFAESWAALDHSIPIGIWKDDKQVEIAPVGQQIVGANDHLIVISEDDSTIIARGSSNNGGKSSQKSQILKQLDSSNVTAQRVLMIGMSANHKYIFDKLVKLKSNLKTLTVCLPDDNLGQTMKKELSKQQTTKVNFILARTDSPTDLARLKPENFDAIIVSHTALRQTGGTDVQTIKSIQILRSLLAEKP